MSLKRFHDAQEGRIPGLPSFEQALRELQQGHKREDWIWYILPQPAGLGSRKNAIYYAISDLQEARNYLKDPVLFERYDTVIRCIEAQLKTIPLLTLMGKPIDVTKLVSSLRLFRQAANLLSQTEPHANNKFKALVTRCDNVFLAIENQEPKPQPKPQPKSTLPQKPAFFKAQPKKTKAHQGIKNPRKIIAELDAYIAKREQERSFHYNLLGFVGMVYLIKDLLSGTDHFNIKSKTTKIAAAQQLKKILDPSTSKKVTLKEIEKNALKEGRLGDIVRRHGGLEKLTCHATKKTKGSVRFSPGA